MVERVVIVGGGLTGLVTAHELQRRGIPSVVLEAGDRPGGRVATVPFADGATAEGGMEEFWDTSPAYPLLRALGLPLIEQPAASSVMIDGRLHAYGADGADYDDAVGAGLGPWPDLVGSVADELAVARRTGCPSAHLGSLMRTSFASFVRGTGLPARVQEWIRIVVESETAVEWECIAALDGIEEMAPFAVDPAAPEGHVNVRVAGGNERLIDAMAAALPAGTIRPSVRVHRVTDDGRRVSVFYDDDHGRSYCERGDHAVLTPPAWQLAGIDVEPGLDRPRRAALSSTAAGSYVKVVLRLDPDRLRLWEREGAHPFPLLTDGPAGCIYLTDGRPTGRAHVLTMLLPARPARAVTGRPHPEIVTRAVTALSQLTDGPAGRPLLGDVRAALTDARVFDHPKAVAYWPHALGRSRFDRLADALRAPHGRVVIGGDSTDSSHSDGAVQAGLRMAAQIATCYGADAGAEASIMARTSSRRG